MDSGGHGSGLAVSREADFVEVRNTLSCTVLPLLWYVV